MKRGYPGPKARPAGTDRGERMKNDDKRMPIDYPVPKG